ncbi:hypothetical protein [Methylobacterium sp. E-046]|uniref:hypothetical protein n=1 Tax=Methylobacterium sp. E-046 TaxID=2836576 RepID=UPI001FBBEDA2|nr:hypothetical protein [Methylobacterium sp. E-046]MCJ2099801.1 hypothetical protein [Methylobacterium sp. E-046]
MFASDTLRIRIDVFLIDGGSHKGYSDARVCVLAESISEIEWPVPVVRAEGLDLQEGHITIWIRSLRGLRFCAKEVGWNLFDPIKAPYKFERAVVVKAILGAVRIPEDASLFDAANACLARMAELGSVVKKERMIPATGMRLFRDDIEKTAEWVIRYKSSRHWRWKGRKPG